MAGQKGRTKIGGKIRGLDDEDMSFEAKPGSVPKAPEPHRLPVAVADQPQTIQEEPVEQVASAERPALPEQLHRPGGIKAAAVPTTLYLLPHEHDRLRDFVENRLRVPAQEAWLQALDLLYAQHGKPPVERYVRAPRRRRPR